MLVDQIAVGYWRDYYRAIAALEKMQAARRREEDRQERKARQERPAEDNVNTPVDSNGFVSYYTPKELYPSIVKKVGQALPPAVAILPSPRKEAVVTNFR
jgi:hypothetical protein